MNGLDLFLIIILFLILLFIILWNCDFRFHNAKKSDTIYENMEPIPFAKRKWNRSPTCKAYMNSTTYDCLKDNLIEQTDNPDEADIIFPCGYNNVENEIRSLPHISSDKKEREPKVVFIIEGADEMTGKDKFWRNVVKHRGIEKGVELCPRTYILVGMESSTDRERLKKDHTDGKLYIMKKNVQRQNGLRITSSLEEIIDNKDGYIIAQELLQNSYLINGRKINLRVYVVVVCHQNQKTVFVFDEGFMYYTKKSFELGDQSRDNHITTGYIDRDVYIHNPLTLTELKKYLDLPEGESYHLKSQPRILSDLEKSIRSNGVRVSDTVFSRIDNLIRETFECFKDCSCMSVIRNSHTENPIYSDYAVEIFGADVAIDENLKPQIMEINKGPDLNPKDDKDSQIKKALVNSVFGLMGLSDNDQGKDLRMVLKM
jgi:Tubulin-tyrosine ligase family